MLRPVNKVEQDGMNKKYFSIWSLFFITFALAAATYADHDVLKSDLSMNSPEEIVAARKFLMKTSEANVEDIKAKIENGDIKGVVVGARNIVAQATLLPILFKDKYEDVYPVEGSKYFYIGAPPEEIELLSDNLKIQAEKLMEFAEAGDGAKANAQIRKIIGSGCGGCHRTYRGVF